MRRKHVKYAYLLQAVDYSIQNGGNLSRAKIATFKHNDVEDLERVIKSELDMHNALRLAPPPPLNALKDAELVAAMFQNRRSPA